MSNVASLRALRSPKPAPAPVQLGPAEVVEAGPTRLVVRLEDDGALVTAELALNNGYEAAVGDLVLLIGAGERHYVIGVLRSSGTMRLAFQGNVDLAAIGGVLRLSGDAVEVEAPEMRMVIGRKLTVLAETVVEKMGALHQHVTGLLSARAGQSHTVIDGSSYQQSKEATVLASDRMTINGKKIHLG